MKTIDERYLNVCEDLGWKVWTDGEEVELSQYSKAGEDFSFCVGVDDFVQNVMEYALDFDVEEHVWELMEAKRNGFRGVPSIRTLVDDADAIADMLETLAISLQKV